MRQFRIRVSSVVTLVALSLAQLSCGAGRRAAPFHENGRELTECGTLADVAPNILAFLRSGGMAPIAEMMEEDIVPSGKLRTALAGLLQIAHDAPPPDGVFGPVKQIFEDAASDPLFDLVDNVLRYLAGMAPFAEPHYAVTTSLGLALTTCDQNGPLQLLDRLVTNRLPRGCTGREGCTLASTKLLQDLAALARNPSLRSVLQGLTLSSVPEDAFVALIEQMVSIATSPSFQFSSLRTVVQNSVYPLIEDAKLREEVDVLLADLEDLTAPETGVQSALATTLICFESKDPSRSIYRLIYNIVVNPNIQFAELMNSIEITTTTDPQERIAEWLHSAILVLEQRKAAHNALIGLVGALLEEKNASRLIPTVVELGNAGAAQDLVDLISRGLNGCSRRPTTGSLP